jgi:hypothetical protein
VREGGAAHRAGINTNDQIIKVKYSKSSFFFDILFYFIFYNFHKKKKKMTKKY